MNYVVILFIHKYVQIIPISVFTEAIMIVIGKVKNNMFQKNN